MTPETFSQLAELVPDGLLLVTGEGCIIAANRTATTVLNTPPSADQSSPITLDDVSSDSSDHISEFLRLCRRSGEELVGAIQFKGRDKGTRLFGRLLAYSNDPAQALLLLRIPDEDAAISRFRILNEKIEELGREITRRRVLENELREQVNLAAFGYNIGLALAEDSDMPAMLRRCAELLVEHLVAAFARIWGVTRDRSALELLASAGMYTHLDGAHSRIQMGQYKIGWIAQNQEPHLTNRVIGDERVHNQEWAQREGMVSFAGYPLIVDGRTVGVMAMFARHELSENSLSAMGSVANGIALGMERNRINNELERNANALKVADKRKDEFLAMLAHELRNPLAPIRSGFELLALEHGETETLTLMQDQVQHMTRLVEDLLDVSRIMRGRIELRREPVQLSEIIDHAVKTVRPAIDAHRHTISVTQCTQPIRLNADRVRLEQVITNLLTNAAKYTPDGGRLCLESRVENDRATIVVRDNVVGIDAEFLPDVFELFAQAERQLARSEGGLGIGLTLVKRLVELHGGSVFVTSEGSGKGSEFVVQLPLAASQAIRNDRHDACDFEIPKECRILVVDDSVGSAKMLRRLLTAIGAENVELAHDGESALEAAHTFQPTVIFLDLGLPRISGFDVAERLRADPEFSSTQLIALTGYGTPEDRRKSRESGFDIHLTKPIGLEQLKQILAAQPRV